MLCLTLLVAPAGWAQEKTGVIAEVNGEVITHHDLLVMLRKEPRYVQIARSYQGKALQDRTVQIRRDTLVYLIEMKLVVQEARKLQITLDEDDEARIDQEWREQIERAGSEENFRRLLEGWDTTEEEWREHRRISYLGERVRGRMMGGDRFIRPQDIRDQYKRMQDEFERNGDLKDIESEFFTKGSLRVRQIRIPGSEKERAEKIRQQAASGEDFAELARSHSNGPHRDDGGLWTFEGTEAPFTSRRSSVIDAMKEGEVSQVIEDRSYLYILILESRVSARLMPFLEVRERIHRILQYRQRVEQRKVWVQKLKEKAHIVYHGMETEDAK
ncbi:MAG: peptidyl-prolyl cis-trans isomerase [Planctomycetota bacterium]|nr:peptidyl-prolyl cis-trans isomerase [Planctomycetota bacterium]